MGTNNWFVWGSAPLALAACGGGSDAGVIDQCLQGRVFSAADGRPVCDVDVFAGEQASPRATDREGQFEVPADDRGDARELLVSIWQ